MLTRKLAPLIALALASCGACAPAAAQSIQLQVGVGAAGVRSIGDGTWIQEGAPNNHATTTTPAFLIGLTGPMYAHGAFDLRWHADYVYIGEYGASVDGVPDDYYDPKTHRVLPTFAQSGERYSPFNGHGHMQGIAFTLDAGYRTHGWRFAVEAGPWVYWETWHESLYALDDTWQDLSHRTVARVGYVAGARAERGPYALSVRYYGVTQSWNPQPGFARGAIIGTFQYRF